jgi:hypothetical protein
LTRKPDIGHHAKRYSLYCRYQCHRLKEIRQSLPVYTFLVDLNHPSTQEMQTVLHQSDKSPGPDATSSPDIFEVLNRVDEWRCGHDLLYRLFTGDDNAELCSFVSGLIGGGEATGLLLERYGDNLDVNARNVLHYLRSSLNADTSCAETRISCHFLLIVSLVLEHEFLNYVVLSVHNRDLLRSYITQFLAPALAAFLQGVITKPIYPAVTCAFDLVSFVDHCRSHYIIRCKPRIKPHEMPKV